MGIKPRVQRYKLARLINYNLLELVVVRLADLIHGTIHTHVALLDQTARWQIRSTCSMGEKRTRRSDVTTLNKVLNTALRISAGKDIANRKRLIDNQNIGLGNRGDSKAIRATIPDEVLQGACQQKSLSSANSIISSKLASINSLEHSQTAHRSDRCSHVR